MGIFFRPRNSDGSQGHAHRLTRQTGTAHFYSSAHRAVAYLKRGRLGILPVWESPDQPAHYLRKLIPSRREDVHGSCFPFFQGPRALCLAEYRDLRILPISERSAFCLSTEFHRLTRLRTALQLEAAAVRQTSYWSGTVSTVV